MPRRKPTAAAVKETLRLCQRAATFVGALGRSGIEIKDVCTAFQAAVDMAVIRQCLTACLQHRVAQITRDEKGQPVLIDGPLFEMAIRDTCRAHSEDAADPLEQWGLAWNDFVAVSPMLVRCLRAIA